MCRRPIVFAVAMALIAVVSPVETTMAASPPNAYTGQARATTTSSTMLGGSVYPGNQPTTYYFQYGETAAYGVQTPVAEVGTGKTSIHVTASLSGLPPDTTWHYRLVAVNASGLDYGHDATFQTKKLPLTFSVDAPLRVTYGRPFVVNGSLSGSHSDHRAIALQGRTSPTAEFAAMRPPTLTDVGGRFSISVPALQRSTQMRIATVEGGAARSRSFFTLVQVRVTLHVHSSARRGFVRFIGTATPTQPGATLVVRRVGPTNPRGPVLTDRLRGSGAHFERLVHIGRGGLYRVTVRPVGLGQTLVPGNSRVVRVR